LTVLAAVCRIGGFIGSVMWREWTRMLGQVDEECLSKNNQGDRNHWQRKTEENMRGIDKD